MPRKIQAFVKPERILTSYDFIDIARGKSVVEFYGGLVSGGIAVSADQVYATSNVKFWSTEIYTSATDGAGLKIDKDFDIDFKFPKIVTGDIVCNVPLGVNTTGNTYTIWADVIAYHVNRAGGQTEMGRGQSDKFSVPAVTGKHYKMMVVKIADVKQRFKSDEILRFSIQVYRSAGEAGGYARLGHDPKNRTFASLGDTDIEQEAPSQLTFQVPFKIFI